MSAPIDLNLLRAFALVHQSGTFSAAAKRLMVPRSTVSRAVSALEDELGTVLFHRTTRRVSTTAEGRSLYARTASSLQALESALVDVPGETQTPSGTLRLTATVDVGSTLLAEAVARFTARYPRVNVEVHLSSSVLDLAADGFDLAVRIVSLPGKLRGAELVAQKIGAVSIQLYAAPTYLARFEPIRTLSDLRQHDWIGFTSVGVDIKRAIDDQRAAGNARDGGSPGGRLPLQGRQRVHCDEMYFVREVIRRGGGVGALPTFLGDPDVSTGALVRVLPRWLASAGRVYLVQPSQKHVPARVSAFRDVLLEVLRQKPFFPDRAR